jgi:hypothetical protein
MSSSSKTSLRSYYITEELRLSVSIVKSGLAALQQHRFGNEGRFIFMLLLSTGLERMMKVLLCLHTYDTEGQFPPRKKLKGEWGHDLRKLWDELAKRGFDEKARLVPVVQEDLKFAQSDPLLTKTLEVLSEFAKTDRYVYMNGIHDPEEQTEKWLGRQWEEVEDLTMDEERKLQLLADERFDECKAHATKAIVVCLERFARTLSETVTHSDLGKEMKSLGTAVMDFSKLDDRLGERDYQVMEP